MITILSACLALLAAMFLSMGTVLQWMGHERCSGRGRSGWAVHRETLWWAGIASSAAGTLSHYGALWIGKVALVLPLSGLHIVLTTIAMSRVRRETLRGKRPVGIGVVALGAILCLVAEAGHTGTPDHLSLHFLIPSLVAVGILCSIPFLPGSAERLAAGSGISFGLSATAWKFASLATDSVSRGFALGGFLAAYVLAFLLIQAGFRRGGAATVNATTNGFATAFAVICATALFGEPVSILSWCGIALVASGVWIASRES